MQLVDYRNRWLDALLLGSNVEGVIALGTAADKAWNAWKQTVNGQNFSVVFAPVTHPTQPESSSGGRAKSRRRHAVGTLCRYLGAGERPPIPEADIPAGLPSWMHQQDGWAARFGADAKASSAILRLPFPPVSWSDRRYRNA